MDCPSCGGSGGDGRFSCTTCLGAGRVASEQPAMTVIPKDRRVGRDRRKNLGPHRWPSGKARIAEANQMLDALEGKGYNGKLNHAYQDGYYALYIAQKFGVLHLDDLRKELGRV